MSLKIITVRIAQPKHRQRAGAVGFTLIELMAVVVMILVLTGLTLRIAGYVQKNMQTQTTRTQIALIGAALESYKADWGYYPLSAPVRSSASMLGETTNNIYLYNSLFLHGKKYLQGFPAGQLRLNYVTGTNNSSGVTNIFDVFGTPFVYFNSPRTTYGLSNNTYGVCSNCGYTVGGQVNVVTYDLFSYGPNRLTYVPNAQTSGGGYPPWKTAGWSAATSDDDDITNWKR